MSWIPSKSTTRLDTISALQPVSIEGVVKDFAGNVATNFNGVVSVIVYDKEADLSTRGTATGVINFKLRNSVIFNGKTDVKDGRFTMNFIVPRDISYRFGRGLINYYATDYDIDANGNCDSFIIGGFYDEAFEDHEPPEVRLFIDDTLFVNGGLTGQNPLLLAYVEDESGINTTGAGIGHDIMAIVDNKETLTMSLNSYYVSNTGDYTRGSISYLMPQMEIGDHTLLFRAWDVMNNPSTREVHFTVEEGLQPAIFDFSVKGLVRTNAIFRLTTDRMQSALNITIDVFDVTGRKVWSKSDISESETNIYNVNWDLQSADGSVPPGVYVARASVSYGSGSHATKAVKFVVVCNSRR